jgi:hypothetical protein
MEQLAEAVADSTLAILLGFDITAATLVKFPKLQDFKVNEPFVLQLVIAINAVHGKFFWGGNRDCDYKIVFHRENLTRELNGLSFSCSTYAVESSESAITQKNLWSVGVSMPFAVTPPG